MLTETEIRETTKRRMHCMLPGTAMGVVGAFGYIYVLSFVRDPIVAFVAQHGSEGLAGFVPALLVLPALAVFLTPCVIGEWLADRFKTDCPACGRDITRSYGYLLATRCCPQCEARILEGGRAHSHSVYKRHRSISEHTVLAYWFWAFPALSALCLTWWYFDRDVFVNCPQCVWVGSLAGTTAAGWAWLRTFDRRYLWPLVVSAILLTIGWDVYLRI